MEEVIKNKLTSTFIVFSMITVGFSGILVFDGMMDEGGVEASTLKVGPMGSGAIYNSIQAAIDNATIGDTINVWAGTYYENVIIYKTLNIIGNGTTNTFIKGRGSGDVIVVTVDWVNITKLSIINNGSNWSDAGLKLNNVKNCCINYINVTNNGSIGIYLNSSTSNSLTNNCCSLNNKYGIYINSSSSNTLINNICSNNDFGIYLNYFSTNNTVKNNICSSNSIDGILIEWYSSNNELINNTCSNNNIGIVSGSSSDANIIINNTCLSNTRGIYLYSSSGTFLINNTCNSNSVYGIWLSYSSSTIFINNSCCSNNNYGIDIFGSSKNSLMNNLCSNNQNGIRLNGWWDPCNTNTIVNNICNSNIHYSIYLESSNSNTIENNIFSNNYYGIYLDGSLSNTIMNNIYSNNDIGINLDSASINNNIYHNNLIFNTEQAIDNGNNGWDNNQEGNYWSDYQGVDNGSGSEKHAIAGDGIGDTNIPHLGLDYYPFVNYSGWLYPGIPILLDPGDFNSDGYYTISWLDSCRTTGYILEEDRSNIFDNSTVIYNGSNLSFEVKCKTNGTYYYRLKTYNEYKQSNWSNTKSIIVDWLPDVPMNFTVQIHPDGNAIGLSWISNLVDTKEYKLEYKIESDAWLPLVTINHPNNNYNHIGLTNGKTYYYKIKAIDYRNQSSDFSTELSAIPLDTTAPATPIGLRAMVVSYNKIRLSWKPNEELDLVGYLIYMNETGAGEFGSYNLIGTILDKVTTYTISGLGEELTYFFKIKAFDEVPNESEFSDLVTVTTLLGPHPPEVNNSIADFEIPEDSYDDTSINLYHWFKDINGDSLDFQYENAKNINITIFKENGTVILRPKRDWNGQETITFYAIDYKSEISDEVTITVTGINDPPGSVEINIPENEIEITEGEPLDFEGNCDDPDLVYGDELTFRWYSNISDKLGEGKILEDIILDVGEHEIRLEVSDKDGKTAIAIIHITVLAIPEYDTDGDNIPDAWEIEYNLNPSNPIDAPLDYDQDGLTNIEEYNFGTNPLIIDTDKDGLSDGKEIKKLRTNATNPDTDGDGHNDGEDKYPLDSTKWQKEKVHTEYKLWFILIAIGIIIIIILIFLFVIKPRKEKGKVGNIMDETPIVTRKPLNQNLQLPLRGTQPQPKYPNLRTAPTVLQPPPQTQSAPDTTQSSTQLSHQKPSTKQPIASQPRTQLSSIFTPRLPGHTVSHQEKTEKPRDIESLLKQGSQAYNHGRYMDAIIAWQQVLEQEPGQHPDIEEAIKDAMEKLMRR